MDASNVFSAIFAGLAFVVSFIAAFIAYDSRKAADRSADSAERANDINLHESRLDIFKGFQAFHGALVQRGELLREADVWPFLSKAHLAEFYFDQTLYKRLTSIADEALAAVSKAEELGFAIQAPDFDRPTKTNMRAALNAKLKSLRTECAEVDLALRAELRLHRRDSRAPAAPDV